MFTISFNNFEKQELLKILNKANTQEAQEFIRRVTSSDGFYCPDIRNDIFNYYKESKSTYALIDNGNLPSGLKINEDNS